LIPATSKLQYYSDKDASNFTPIERTVDNGKRINADMKENTIENELNFAVYDDITCIKL
jgi:hypothetical protein